MGIHWAKDRKSIVCIFQHFWNTNIYTFESFELVFGFFAKMFIFINIFIENLTVRMLELTWSSFPQNTHIVFVGGPVQRSSW